MYGIENHMVLQDEDDYLGWEWDEQKLSKKYIDEPICLVWSSKKLKWVLETKEK